MTAIDTLREKVLARARDLGKSFPQIRMGVEFQGLDPEESDEPTPVYRAGPRSGIYLGRGCKRVVLLEPLGIRETGLVVCFLPEYKGPVLLPNFQGGRSLLQDIDAWRRYGRVAMEQLRQWRSVVLANGLSSLRVKLGEEGCPVCRTVRPADEFWPEGLCPQKYCLDRNAWREAKEGSGVWST